MTPFNRSNSHKVTDIDSNCSSGRKGLDLLFAAIDIVMKGENSPSNSSENKMKSFYWKY